MREDSLVCPRAFYSSHSVLLYSILWEYYAGVITDSILNCSTVETYYWTLLKVFGTASRFRSARITRTIKSMLYGNAHSYRLVYAHGPPQPTPTTSLCRLIYVLFENCLRSKYRAHELQAYTTLSETFTVIKK